MQEVVAGFSVDTSRQKSLAIIKEKLKQDKNRACPKTPKEKTMKVSTTQ